MTFELKAYIWASPEHGRLQPERLEVAIYYSQFTYFCDKTCAICIKCR